MFLFVVCVLNWSIIALEKEMATYFIILAGDSMDGGAWETTVYGVTKCWARLSNQQFDLIKRMAHV